MRFIQTINHKRVVNPQSVAWFECLQDSKGIGFYRAYDAQHNVLGEFYDYQVRDLQGGEIVTDTTGIVVVNVWFGDDETWTERVPVVAWRIEMEQATPVTYEELPEYHETNGQWLLELPEHYGPRRWVRPDDRRFDSLDEAIAELRQEWDDRQAQKRAATTATKPEKDDGERRDDSQARSAERAVSDHGGGADCA